MIKHGHLRHISVKINRGWSHDSYEHSFVINFDHIGLFMAELMFYHTNCPMWIDSFNTIQEVIGNQGRFFTYRQEWKIIVTIVNQNMDIETKSALLLSRRAKLILLYYKNKTASIMKGMETQKRFIHCMSLYAFHPWMCLERRMY